jgi:16S rRNA (guanine527-N7)-methyltransferase
LLAFLVLLQKWNRHYNLTAIRDLDAAIELHLLDSLALAPFLRGVSVLDVGTGAGLPGIPLAMVATDKRFWLLDASAKKTRFIRHAAIELGLINVEVVTARVEDFVPPDRGFDNVLARAFAGLGEIWALTSRLLAPGGRILAQKGQLPKAEIEDLADCPVAVHRLSIPGLDAERHLIEMPAI